MQTETEKKFYEYVEDGMKNGHLDENHALASALNKLGIHDYAARNRLVNEYYRQKKIADRKKRCAGQRSDTSLHKERIITPAMRLGAYQAERKHRKDLGDDY